jgi:hypothetical protein
MSNFKVTCTAEEDKSPLHFLDVMGHFICRFHINALRGKNPFANPFTCSLAMSNFKNAYTAGENKSPVYVLGVMDLLFCRFYT